MESPRNFRFLSKRYSKIPSTNFSSLQQEKNILWRFMRVVTVKLKKSKSTNDAKTRRELDQESQLIINDGLNNHIDLIDQHVTDNKHDNDNNNNNDPNPIPNRPDPTTRLRIYVKIASKSKAVVVEAKGYNIVNDIKSKIRTFEGIEPSEYSLFHNGKRVEDYRTLTSLGVRTESTLHVIFRPKTVFRIRVKTPGGKILEFEADVMYTVRDVKTIVESFVGCPVSDCAVVHDQNEIADEGKSLAFYGVGEGAILELVSRWVQIFVKTWGGKTVTLFVRKSSTVGEVKEKLFCKVGVPIVRQRIEFAGKRLDGDRSLSSYGVCKESTLRMVL